MISVDGSTFKNMSKEVKDLEAFIDKIVKCNCQIHLQKLTTKNTYDYSKVLPNYKRSYLCKKNTNILFLKPNSPARNGQNVR